MSLASRELLAKYQYNYCTDFKTWICFIRRYTILKMKSLAVLLLAFVAAVSATPAAAPPGPPKPPTPPKLTHLLTAKVTASGPIEIGPQPGGIRRVYPITGGTFTGPKMNGTLLPVGADFSILRPGNKFSPDGIAIMQTSDGANILFKALGYQTGEYVHCAITFETGFEKYAWLNSVVALSQALVAVGDTTEVALNIFVVSLTFIFSLADSSV